MQSQQRVRLGFIGFGNYARRAYWPWLSQTSYIEVAGISCDLRIREEGLDQYKNIPFVFRPEDMLAKIPLDVVIVTTPHTFHYKHCKLSLEYGCHVLVDKPLACDLAEAQELTETADAKGKYLAVGLERRYEDVYRTAKEIVEQKKLGEIRCIDCSLVRPVDAGFAKNWRNTPELSGGGILIDTGYHAIDVVFWITGLSLVGIHSNLIFDDLKVEKSCSISATFSNGAVGNFLFTYSSPLHLRQEQIWFYGTEGNLGILDYRPSGGKRAPSLVFQPREQKGSVNLYESGSSVSHAESPLVNLIEAVRLQRPLIAHAKSNLSTIQFITNAYLSAANNHH